MQSYTLIKGTNLMVGAFLSIILFFSNLIWAIETEEQGLKNFILENKLKLDTLAENKIWKQLIFFQHDYAEVTSSNFYLSPAEKISPYSELISTLEFFSSNSLAKCRYPARYLFLARELDMDFLHTGLAACEDLPSVEGKVSLLLVGGFFKNPASSFGHLLLSIKDNRTNRLLADSYNFGAVNLDSNILLYIYRGVFGYYPAAFEKMDFFYQEKQYLRVDNRDLWEYELNLTDWQIELLNYHLYEVEGHHFDYFFFKQNCAYRTGELLELISDVKITNRIFPWYSPDYIGHQLYEYNSNIPDKLIKKETYHPSPQSNLFFKFNLLSTYSQSIVNKFLKTENLELLKKASIEEQTQILDFLLFYTNLKLSNSNDVKYIKRRKNLIRTRISLPPSPISNEQQKPYKTASVEGPKPNKIGLLANEKVGFSFSMYQRDSLNKGTDINTEFRALEIFYQPLRKYSDVMNFDLVKIRSLRDLSQYIYDEPIFSWQIQSGVTNDYFSTHKKLAYVRPGIGLAYGFNDSIMAYQMLGASLHNQKYYIDLNTSTGIIFKNNLVSAQVEHKGIFRNRQYSDEIEFTLKREISKNTDIRAHWTSRKNSYSYASLGLNWYW